MAEPGITPQLLQFSVVIAGRSHNPTLLNPDFLELRDIVMKDWGWKVAEVITTPPLALVRYDNGVSIHVEADKLQVVDLNAGPDPTKSRAAGIAASYVKTLPHVRFSAVGVNYQSVIEVPGTSPKDFIKNRFLSSGPWDAPEHPLAAAGVRLQYPLGEDGRITLSVDTGTVELGRIDKERLTKLVVLTNANFHRPCKDYPGEEKVAEHLGHAAEDWALHQLLLEDAVMREV